MTFARILVAFDGSPQANAALTLATQLAADRNFALSPSSGPSKGKRGEGRTALRGARGERGAALEAVFHG
jgi:nucleotide-binding universal stress UspA family protein